MSSGKVHAIIGIAVAVLMYFVLGVPLENPFQNSLLLLPSILLVIFLYAQIPDIDHQSSKSTGYITALLLGISCLFLYLEDITKVWMALVPITVIWVLRVFKLIKHRGFFHTMFAQIVMAVPLFFLFNVTYMYYGLAASMSHIGADIVSTYFKRKKNTTRRY